VLLAATPSASVPSLPVSLPFLLFKFGAEEFRWMT
jgi:hypothetical protein